MLVWRGTVLPDEKTREEALEKIKRSLDDVLDWSTAQFEGVLALVAHEGNLFGSCPLTLADQLSFCKTTVKTIPDL